MIYDCFLFFNEFDLLEIRLHTLNEVVDRFVLVEADRTFMGQPKELLFSKYADSRFDRFRDKMEVIAVTDFPPGLTPLQTERYNRDQIARAWTACQPGDIIMVSDCDEIPRPEAVRAFRPDMDLASFKMKMFCYAYNNLNCVRSRWKAAKILTYDLIKNYDYSRLDLKALDPNYICSELTPELIRWQGNKISRHVLKNAGWHFTYVFDLDNLWTKINSNTDSLFVLRQDNNTKDKIAKLVTQGKDIFNLQPSFRTIAVNEKNLPKFICDNQEKYNSLLKPHNSFKSFCLFLYYKLFRKYFRIKQKQRFRKMNAQNKST